MKYIYISSSKFLQPICGKLGKTPKLSGKFSTYAQA